MSKLSPKYVLLNIVKQQGLIKPRPWPVCLLLVALTGCESADFYWQASSGHLNLMKQREPIDELLQDQQLDASRRAKLEQAVAIRDYAEDTLALPVGNSYQHLVESESPYVTWNVFAAQPLAMEAQQWCFPVAGCVTYRGYFKQEAAQKFAAKQRNKGLDVHIGGATAYSTLGWFNDPLLSSFLNYDDTRMAALLFHELAHQVLYVKGDTAFNESFASAVEELALQQWLRDVDRQEELAKWAQHEAWVETFTRWLLKHREALQAIYQSDLDDSAKLDIKEAMFEALKADYPVFRDAHQGDPSFNAWMAKPLSNASLLSIGAYNDWVGAFKQLFNDCGGDWPVFYHAAEQLAQREPEARRAALEGLQLEQPVALCQAQAGDNTRQS